jgi:flagellar hook assembly protein FlgD
MLRSAAAGTLAVVLLLSGALAPAARGDLLADVGAIPNPFSPNADGVFDSTAVYYTLGDAAAVLITVREAGGAPVDTVWSGQEQAGSHSHWWAGRSASGTVPDGDYEFSVLAIPDVGLEEVSFGFRIDTAAPTIVDFRVSPSRFSPDGDGVGDSLLAVARFGNPAEDDHGAIRIFDEADSFVAEPASATGAETLSAYWGGLGADGAPAPDGLYLARVVAWDDAGNMSRQGTIVDLDTAPPALEIVLPDTTLTVIRVEDTSAVVRGRATDRAGVTAVETSLDGGAWTETSFVDSGAFYAWRDTIACSSCVPGVSDETVSVRVRAHDGTATADGAGHVNGADAPNPLASVDVVFDVAPPIRDTTYTTSPSATYTSGDQITITTIWDAEGYEIDADLSRVDSGFDPSDVQVTGGTGGHYTVKYRTSATNTLVPNYGAVVLITATDYFGRAVTDSSLTVTILPGGTPGPSGVYVDANAFDPTASETVTIGLGAAGAAVDIYNVAGTLVRSFEKTTDVAVSWNGRNDGGEIVASGVYFIRIRTDAGEVTRIVAVVK